MISDEKINFDKQPVASTINKTEHNLIDGLKDRLVKILRPNLIILFLTFLSFIIMLLITRKFLMCLLIAFAIYITSGFLLNDLFNKQLEHFKRLFSRSSSKKKYLLIPKQSILLYQYKKSIIGYALIKIVSLPNRLSLKPLWNFLERQAISIKNTHSGIYFVIRKESSWLTKTKLKETPEKLMEEIQIAVISLQKLIETEYEMVEIEIIIGQELIQDIIALGLPHQQINDVLPPSLSDLEIFHQPLINDQPKNEVITNE
jgi:hypothetical protein